MRDTTDLRCLRCAAGDRRGFFARDLAIAFQPIVDLQAGRIFAHEALVRGPRGEGAAHVLSTVTEANRYAFDQTLRVRAIGVAAELGLAGAVSINIMPNAVYDPEHCIRATLQAAERYRWPPERIIFEMTEDEQVRDVAHLKRIVDTYRGIGFRTAIDDFGAGYAGLNLLAELQPDILKLDKTLVRGVHADPVRQAMMKGLRRMAEGLDVTLLAEGVETGRDAGWLAGAGLHLQQGWLFGRPRLMGAATEAELHEAGAFDAAQPAGGAPAGPPA